MNLYGLKEHFAIHLANIGHGEESWQTYNMISQTVFRQTDDTFGYFVYSPDVLAYPAKYAMILQSERSKKHAYAFKKMPITYLIIAPPPQNNPYMNDLWWKINRLHLTKNPESTITFPSGYKIERYMLTPEETQITFDPQIDPGIFFR
jgi:hypothetical protein